MEQAEPSEALERIVVAATALFAERGLHGVTTRELAAAVGLNIATVHYHAGSKRELYAAVLRRLDRVELEMIAGFTRAFGTRSEGTREWLRGFLGDVVDTVVAFIAAHPELPRMRVRQWLEPTEGVDDPQADAGRAHSTLLEAAFEAARVEGLLDRGLDTVMFAHSFDWLVAGFFSGGAPSGERRRTRTAQEIDAFRLYLRAFTLRMLGLDELLPNVPNVPKVATEA